jgi:peptidoglycan L-alanyl-D-glutamate endopeptidase CwlK
MLDPFTGVHPTAIMRVKLVHTGMGAIGHPMRATDGLRTLLRQQELWAQGRTTPGKIVTFCDGLLKPSNHQAKADGLGHAVDSCFLGPDPYLEHTAGAARIWAAYGALVEAVGLGWGGRFHSIDQPHAELV